jgi:hypothetical protein
MWNASLRWLLILLWLFLFLFRLQRRGLGALLFLRRTLFFFRRRSTLVLRTLGWGRGLWLASRLIPVGFWRIVRMHRRWMI